MNRTLVFVMLLSCSSCMVGPKYRVPATPVPGAFKETPPQGWKESSPQDGEPRGKWWTIYNDAQLNALEEQVNISNQNVLAAEAQFRAARAAVRTARSGQFPSVTLAPAASTTGTALGSQQVYTFPADVSYQADVWGSIRRSVAANSAIAQASYAQLENARLLYQAELAVDYFQLQGLDASRQLLESTVKSFEQYVQLTQDRFEGGIATQGDVALARTQLETARAQLVDLGAQRAVLEHAIAVLAGKPPSELAIVFSPNQMAPPPVPPGLPSNLLERRPDIATAERQMAASNEQIGIAKSALYPSFLFSGGTGSQTRVFADLLTWPSRFWSLGPQMAQPLFDAGRRRAQVKVTEANYDATVANYRQTVLSALQQVEDNLARLRILAEEAEITGRAVKSAQQSLDISTIQYRGGLANYLQVITAQTALLQNQRTAVNILSQRMVASVSLIQALGGGWSRSQLPNKDSLRR